MSPIVYTARAYGLRPLTSIIIEVSACAYGSSPNGGDTARIVERSEREHAGSGGRTHTE